MNTDHLLAQLARPACFPHAPAAVHLVQTHLSIVCLADDRVYKLKKAVTLPFVDFATLSARRQACRDEVRLNRRLCPDTYLGTASLRPGADGALRFAAIGDDEGHDDVDVAVVMRRLPQARMLDELLREHAVTRAEIVALARHVAAFHARTATVPAAIAAATPEALASFAAANFAEILASASHGLPMALLHALRAATIADFAAILPELQARARRGLIVDGHGDLHARNVCMTEPPTVYDCIEFEPRFRIGDVATENAFLVMDLRYRGAPELAAAYVEAYVAASADRAQVRLLPTLCSYRAMVRTKVALLAAAESTLPAADRAAAHHSAWRHLMLAAAYVAEVRGPFWLVVCGPPASGKSRLCEQLAAVGHWPHEATDRVRKALAGLAATAPARAEHYTAAFSAATYGELRRRAGEHTRQGQPMVLLDGNFPTPAHRADALAAARAAGARLVVVYVGIDVAIATARAAARAHEPGNISDATPAVAARLAADFVAPNEREGLDVLAVDGMRPSADLAADVMSHLLTRAPKSATA